MGKVFSVHCSESFLNVVAEFTLDVFYSSINSVSNIIVIVSSNEEMTLLDKLLAKSSYGNYSSLKIKVISLSDIDHDVLVNNSDFVKIISPLRKLMLLMEFIKLWNSEHCDNYPLSLSYELSALLNEMYTHCIPLSSFENLFEYDLPEHSQKAVKFLSYFSKKWTEILQQENVLDILEHRSLYINTLIRYLEEGSSNSTIIFAGMAFNTLIIDFVRTLYKLPNTQIILPYVDVGIDEKNWKLLEESHYQYCVKNLLDVLKIDRNNIVFLGKQNNRVFIDSIFNFDLFLEEYHKGRIQICGSCDYVQVITCMSDEEESHVISALMKKYKSKDVAVFTNNVLLSKRVDSIVNLENLPHELDVNYLILSFVSNVLEVVVSSWNPISLLSLLKHPFVNLGYSEDEYSTLISNFELKIIRLYSSYDFVSIDGNVREKVPDLIHFWEKITSVVLPLVDVKHGTISSIVKAHIVCLRDLLTDSTVFSYEKIEGFFDNFQSACANIRMSGIDIYYEILISVLHNNLFVENYRLSSVNLYKREVVIFSGFNELNYGTGLHSTLLSNRMRSKLGLPSIQREKGYFAYILYSFFYSDKIYITRSLKSFGKVNEESIWIKKIKIMAKIYNYKNLEREDYLRSEKGYTNSVINLCDLRPQPNPEINHRVMAFNILSTTAVEILVKNPYVFYLNNILNILPYKDINEKFSMKDFGIIVHSVLHKYLVSPKNQQDYGRLIKIAESEFLNKYKNFPQVETILWPKFQQIAEQFFEMNLNRNSNIDKIITEHFFSWEINNNVKIISKCDRVECLKDNSIAIIDYKTGVIPSQLDISCGIALQMIIQALTVKKSLKKNISDLMYWKIGAEDIKVVYIDNYEEIMEKTEIALKELILEYLVNRKPFIASHDVAGFGSYDLLIRLKEWWNLMY
ncbi:PD-(D/E)XK nuclease family protein [Ehrlichia ruminantium]|uniref:PD-(D/E)XK endonuclease-like domain-containing protein n=2 Tax=Ehrlichia ruminantium TaxID=779 RepID=A0A170SN41_EHRRU|nr:PD-(D/E)XK nuclease family protein [Ehrlichia ruminantium]GAT78173.1 hypothetical protein EHRUM3_03860 [Ehrlichia ruminantium]